MSFFRNHCPAMKTFVLLIVGITSKRPRTTMRATYPAVTIAPAPPLRAEAFRRTRMPVSFSTRGQTIAPPHLLDTFASQTTDGIFRQTLFSTRTASTGSGQYFGDTLHMIAPCLIFTDVIVFKPNSPSDDLGFLSKSLPQKMPGSGNAEVSA
ncbi:hypothetical protein [Pseudomonas alliivorans]|uniref:hypothetical protein n=1 Tax=Pseudomonas alliivorans TaxID=2810613 RepID=UPI002ED2833A|nr:hypothetical protein [Pseudomonas alliivorans]